VDAYSQAHSGDTIQVGVRPEQLFLAAEGEGDIELNVDVLAVEDLGADCLVYIQLAGNATPLIWRAPAGYEIEVGTSITVSATADSLHLFDTKTEARIEI
jgi:ABC-type sugar transport system ATPase subunit